jgi:aminoglycoside 3'-phosphotransferase-1
MDSQREQACAAVPTPAGIAAVLTGYQWARDAIGESGCAVYRLHGKANSPALFLKHGKDAAANELAAEMVRLCWLADYATVDAIAVFLRQLHAIPVSTCPFTSDHAYRLASARARIDAGLVDENDFDEEREGWTAEQVWQAAQLLLPLAPDPVVTHGDFSLDNLFICNGEVAGCIDTGRVGIADRYQDLAIAWNCLGEFGDALQERFLTQYGLPGRNQGKLQFHLLLDELF